tara:strand:- start:11318 stop:11809 length:492 start_codon:yes stop_codon:yes gene_type:complete
MSFKKHILSHKWSKSFLMSEDNPNERKKRGNPNFYKGMPSANPKGRPKGSLNKYTELSRELMSERGPEIVNKVISLAMEGDVACLKMCMDRILPPQRAVEIKHENDDMAINIVVEQIGTSVQKAVEDAGGTVIEHSVESKRKEEKKKQDKKYEEIIIEVSNDA